MPPATPSRGLSEWVSHSHATSLGLDIRFLEANTQRRQHPMATPVRSLSTAVVLQAWQGPYRMRLQDGTELEAAPGEGFFAPPLLQHQFFVPPSQSVISCWCHFDATLFGVDLFHFLDLPSHLPTRLATRIGELIRCLVQFRETGSPPPLALALREQSTLLQIIEVLLEDAEYADLPIHALNRLAPLIRWTEQHLEHPLNRGDMAARLGVSEAHLHTLFHDAIGMPPVEYLRMARLRRARRLLTGTRLTVHEVATQCGFDSPEYFSRFFTKRTGLRPTTFREASRDPKS